MEIEIKPRSKMGTSSSITGVVGWCDGAGINFLCRGVLQIWILVWQEPTALAVGADGVVWTFFSPVYHFSFVLPPPHLEKIS